MLEECEGFVVSGVAQAIRVELACLGSARLGPVVDSDGRVIDDPKACPEQPEAQAELRVMLGRAAAQAMVEANLSNQLPADAEVDALEDRDVSRGTRAEMVPANEPAPSADGADNGLL